MRKRWWFALSAVIVLLIVLTIRLTGYVVIGAGGMNPPGAQFPSNPSVGSPSTNSPSASPAGDSRFGENSFSGQSSLNGGDNTASGPQNNGGPTPTNWTNASCGNGVCEINLIKYVPNCPTGCDDLVCTFVVTGEYIEWFSGGSEYGQEVTSCLNGGNFPCSAQFSKRNLPNVCWIVENDPTEAVYIEGCDCLASNACVGPCPQTQVIFSENKTNCPADCSPQNSSCGDGICSASLGENVTTCPGDCAAYVLSDSDAQPSEEGNEESSSQNSPNEQSASEILGGKYYTTCTADGRLAIIPGEPEDKNYVGPKSSAECLDRQIVSKSPLLSSQGAASTTAGTVRTLIRVLFRL